jgi:hypothetical protein
MKSIPAAVTFSLYQILCTESDPFFVHEIFLTLCSFWKDSYFPSSHSSTPPPHSPLSVTTDFKITREELDSAIKLFVNQLKGKKPRCIANCNLRYWLQFIGHLIATQLGGQSSLVSTITSHSSTSPPLISEEDLLWILNELFNLSSNHVLLDIFTTTESSSSRNEIEVRSNPTIGPSISSHFPPPFTS